MLSEGIDKSVVYFSVCIFHERIFHGVFFMKMCRAQLVSKFQNDIGFDNFK